MGNQGDAACLQANTKRKSGQCFSSPLAGRPEGGLDSLTAQHEAATKSFVSRTREHWVTVPCQHLRARCGAVGRQASKGTPSLTASFPALTRASLPLKKDAGSKKKKKVKGERVLYCSKNLSVTATGRPGLSGAVRGPPLGLLGLLDDTFAEVCHFGIFYFLLVQLILSPKE